MEHTHLDPTRASPPRPRAPTIPAPVPPPQGVSAGDLRSLGDFHILRRLGEGGMGAVYLGYDRRHDRQVALKVLNDNLAATQGYIDRFHREARSGGQLNHPNIVRTYSAARDQTTGKYYLVLEYVDGPSAQALLQTLGKLSVGDAAHIALNVARALEHAHSRSIVHRDIKPDNILTTRSGVPKLGDLGLAKRTDEPSHLTGTRQGFGTTAYMPYEQAINARKADGRSDIYALGATLYHLVTGHVPFPGDNHLEVVERKNQGHYRPASSHEPAVPAALDLILGKMLARQPADRYQTASELIIDLERSRLAVAMPTFADPELARNDPWFLACQSTAEPTRMDPDGSGVQKQTAEVGWVVRYRNRAGRPFMSRLSTDEVRERLEEGTLPPDAEGRRENEDGFRPLARIDEFENLVSAAEAEQDEAEEPAEGWRLGTFAGTLAAALAMAALVVGLVRVLWYR